MKTYISRGDRISSDKKTFKREKLCMYQILIINIHPMEQSDHTTKDINAKQYTAHGEP